MTTRCRVCAEVDPELLFNDGSRWHCLNCGNVWSETPVETSGAAGTPPRGSAVHGVEEVIGLLRHEDGGLARLGGPLRSGDLRHFLRARLDPADPRWAGAQEVLERLGSTPPLALFALRYVLAPEDPLELAPGTAIRSPAEIPSLVAPGVRSREPVLAGLRALAGDGRLGEWVRLRGAEGWAGAVAAMETARRTYPKEPELPVYALLWHLAPDLGLQVDGDWVKTPKELAVWIERDAAHRERALTLLDRGWIPTWLAALKGPELGRDLGSLLAPGLTRAARVETLLWLLDPERPGAQVVAEPGHATLSLSESSGTTVLQLTLRAQGPGHAWGTVDLQGAIPGVELVTKTFDGTPATLSLRINPAALPARLPRDLALVISVRGPRADQSLRVPIELRVRRSSPYSPRRWVSTPAGSAGAAEGHGIHLLLCGISGAMIGAQIGAILGFIGAFVVAFVLAIPAVLVNIFVPGVFEQMTSFVGKLGGSVGILVCGGFGLVLGAGLGSQGWPATILLVFLAALLGGFWLTNLADVVAFVKEMTFLG